MSSYIKKFKIRYDNNDGTTEERNIFCMFDCCCDVQRWVEEDGTPLDFRCVTDSEAHVISYCIAGILTGDKYFYWEEIKDFELPDIVYKYFYSK